MKKSEHNYFVINLLSLKKVMIILLKKSKSSTFAILILAILLGILPSINVRLTQKLINCMEGQVLLSNILIIAILYVMIDMLIYLLGMLQNYISSIFRQKVNLCINLAVLEKVTRLKQEDFEDSEIYNKIKRAQSQSNNVVLDYYLQFISIIQKLISLFFMGTIIAQWNIYVVILIALLSSVQMFFTLRLNREQYNIIRLRTQDERKKMYYEYILTNDTAFKEIKIYNVAAYFLGKYKEISNDIILQDRRIMKKMTIFQTSAGIGQQILIGIMFVKMVMETYAKKILVGDLLAYIKGLSSVKSSIEGVFSQWENINQMALFMQMLFELLELESEESNESDGFYGVIESIELRNLSFRYRNSQKYALKNINLTVRKGEKLAIVRRNGSGKSTLVKMISGLYDRYEGDILINGVNVKNIGVNELQKSIGIMFQDFAKFELTIRENVGISQLEKIKDTENMIQAMKNANIDKKFSDNVEQQLGYWFEFGTQLSGGEWLKIAIARAFFGEKEIYILDEPNSALDSIATNEVRSSIEKLFCKKIGIMISHKLEMVSKFDNIVVLDEGKIIDQGRHGELLSTSKMYKTLYEDIYL